MLHARNVVTVVTKRKKITISREGDWLFGDKWHYLLISDTI
jgi:hypothetical protein